MSFITPKTSMAGFSDPALRGAILEQIAQFIEQREEISVSGRPVLQPRTPGNSAGFAFAIAIRAMK